MKIRKILMLFFLYAIFMQNSSALPKDFYMKETYKKIVREDLDDKVYFIEKKVNNNFSSVSEMYDKKSKKIIEKSETVFINPINVESYNDYYQITKNYKYKGGEIKTTNFYIGNSNNCAVKCGLEAFYKNSKIYRKQAYPSCLSLFDMEKRTLKYDDDYVRKNCIPN